MRSLFLAIAMAFCVSVSAQDINLPKPQVKGKSMSMSQTLASRHSVRSYSEKELTLQQLSNVCWAACGVSRSEKFRTSPTALNKQEIRLFVFIKQGVYEYDALKNVLVEKAKGDNRQLMAGGSFKQDFVMEAPVTLLMVIDGEKFTGSKETPEQHALMMCCVDAGNVSENINLYCQSVGLATVPRASMDVKGIKELLGLDASQIPIMNNPVGYEKTLSAP